MNFALDIIVVVIFVAMIFTTYKKGFVKAVLEFLSIIIAFFVAKAYTPMLAGFLSDNVISKSIGNGINNMIQSNTVVSQAVNSINGFFESIQKSEVITGLQSSVEGTPTQSVIDSLTQSISLTISEIVAFIILFILCLIALKIIIIIVDAIFKLPIVGAINKALGILLGVAKGFLFVFLFCLLVSFIVMMGLGSENPWITQDIISKTIVFRLFYENNFIAGFLF